MHRMFRNFQGMFIHVSRIRSEIFGNKKNIFSELYQICQQYNKMTANNKSSANKDFGNLELDRFCTRFQLVFATSPDTIFEDNG